MESLNLRMKKIWRYLYNSLPRYVRTYWRGTVDRLIIAAIILIVAELLSIINKLIECM